MTDIFSEIEIITQRCNGGGWAAFIIRALWPYENGLSRKEVIDAVLEEALDRGMRTPKSFADTLQATFQRHNSGSKAYRASKNANLFQFVGVKGSGVWGLNRDTALAWMAANRRACDFAVKTKK